MRCKSLQNINIPDSVTNIGNYAFRDCYSLQRIVIPYGTSDKFSKMISELTDKLVEEGKW